MDFPNVNRITNNKSTENLIRAETKKQLDMILNNIYRHADMGKESLAMDISGIGGSKDIIIGVHLAVAQTLKSSGYIFRFVKPARLEIKWGHGKSSLKINERRKEYERLMNSDEWINAEVLFAEKSELPKLPPVKQSGSKPKKSSADLMMRRAPVMGKPHSRVVSAPSTPSGYSTPFED